MAKKRKDANTQTFLFGIIPLNRNAASHTRARSQPKRDDKALRRQLAKLERTRDQHYEGDATWTKYNKQIERFKRENGL